MIPYAGDSNAALRLPAARTLDNSRQMSELSRLGQVAGQQFKKAMSDKEARELAGGLMKSPEQEAMEIQGQQIALQDRKDISQAQARAVSNQKEHARRTRYAQIMSDDQERDNFLKLQQKDPQMAAGVMNALISEDREAKQQMAAEAQKAMNLWSNVSNLIANGEAEQANMLVKDIARERHQRGEDITPLVEYSRMPTDEAGAFARTQMMKLGHVVGLKEVKQLTEKERADLQNKDEDQQLARDKFNAEQRLARDKFNADEKRADAPKEADFGDVQSLRKEFAAETKPFIDVNDAYGRVLASADEPSAAGDLALIFNYMKVLDPGSTVREGEFANAQNAGSVGQRVYGLYNSVKDGKRLSESQRKDFVDRAGKLFKKAKTINDKRAEEFARLAKLRGINPDEVIINRDVAGQSSNDDLLKKYGIN
jgi:hypothetical protein